MQAIVKRLNEITKIVLPQLQLLELVKDLQAILILLAKIELLVCTQLDTMIEEGSPPDLVLDLSYTGEMIKSISQNLGLPTVTSSLGAEKDIR